MGHDTRSSSSPKASIPPSPARSAPRSPAAKYVSNASSSQGILYGIESHYVTVGKKVGGFVLQVAARSVSKHSLNVMAGHDDVYALLQSGYTILFGSNPQEAADLAAISYKISAPSLIPVANAMDGFATSHMLSEAMMPEDDLLREFLGDPTDRIECPTVAQEMLFGAKGRVFQLKRYLDRHAADVVADDAAKIVKFLDDQCRRRRERTMPAISSRRRSPISRRNCSSSGAANGSTPIEKGTRQRVPAQVDVHNPGLTGGVQNQPDFQAGSADHRTHFVRDVPRFAREAMAEYSALTGRELCADQDLRMRRRRNRRHRPWLGHRRRRGGRRLSAPPGQEGRRHVDQDAAAVPGSRSGRRAEGQEGSDGAGALRRHGADQRLSLRRCARRVENADEERHPGIPAMKRLPKLTTAIFGLGAHDLQPRHLIAAFDNMDEQTAPFVYLGTPVLLQEPDARTWPSCRASSGPPIPKPN